MLIVLILDTRDNLPYIPLVETPGRQVGASRRGGAGGCQGATGVADDTELLIDDAADRPIL